MKTVLDNHPDVNCLVGIWAYNAHQIVQVVQDRGIREKTKVVVFDAAADALADMDKGLIDAMIVQNPFQMGYEGTKIMKALVEADGTTLKSIYPAYDPATGKFEGEGGDVFTTELRVVVPTTSLRSMPDMFDSNTKFFNMQDFGSGSRAQAPQLVVQHAETVVVSELFLVSRTDLDSRSESRLWLMSRLVPFVDTIDVRFPVCQSKLLGPLS